jgi:preprotein translocase subunit Sss1
MATIYKVKVNGGLTKANYTLGGARAVRKRLEDKGYEPKIVVWAERQMIVDTTSDYTGVVSHYRKPTEKELKQMIKVEQKA